MDVCCGETNLPTDVERLHHFALQEIRIAQIVLSYSHIPLRQSLTNGGRTDVLATIQFLRLHHFNAQFLAIAHIILEPLIAVMSETMVITNDQHLHLQLLFQHLSHEVMC